MTKIDDGGQALVGLATDHTYPSDLPMVMALTAYRWADAMIAEKRKREEPVDSGS